MKMSVIQTALTRKETNSCVVAGNWWTNSSRVVPKNIASKLAETENFSRVVSNNITTKLGEPENSSRAVLKNFATKLTEPENSSRIVPENFLTKLAEPAGVTKRDFASSIADVSNYLDGLENNSSSSSSSSSSSGEFDISSFTPVKRTKLSQGKQIGKHTWHINFLLYGQQKNDEKSKFGGRLERKTKDKQNCRIFWSSSFRVNLIVNY